MEVMRKAKHSIGLSALIVLFGLVGCDAEQTDIQATVSAGVEATVSAQSEFSSKPTSPGPELTADEAIAVVKQYLSVKTYPVQSFYTEQVQVLKPTRELVSVKDPDGYTHFEWRETTEYVWEHRNVPTTKLTACLNLFGSNPFVATYIGGGQWLVTAGDPAELLEPRKSGEVRTISSMSVGEVLAALQPRESSGAWVLSETTRVVTPSKYHPSC